MRPSETTQLLRRIGAMWPSFKITDEVIQVWAASLVDVDAAGAVENLELHAASDQALWPPSLPIISRGAPRSDHADWVMQLAQHGAFRSRLTRGQFPDERSFRSAVAARFTIQSGTAAQARRAYLAAWKAREGLTEPVAELEPKEELDIEQLDVPKRNVEPLADVVFKEL